MKKSSKSLLFLGLTAASLSFAGTPQFPFPQNQAYPYGNTFKSATIDSLKSHFKMWKGAWYTEQGTYYQKYAGGTADANAGMPSGTARVISPNDHSEYTVSEGIGYGMLIMVYMSSAADDHQAEFDKLWKYWKCYGKGLNGSGCNSWSGQGMDWEIDNEKGTVIGSGTASDAEFDAAVALIMAYKQWGDASYLSDAKQLISWIKSNDMESDGSIKPGSNWNPAFNPSYTAVAAFQLFYEVTNDSFWQTAISTSLTHLRACQNAVTGLMPDWCDWSSHQAIQPNAAVSGGYLGFYDDAARTPWRLAWGYAWYGIAGAKEANDAIIGWLDSATYGYAGMILPGYNLDGSSDNEVFVSSTYAGGLGLSMLSADAPKSYLENLYYTLSNTEGKETLTASKGENYFAATLNVLYMLLLTGNMPNFYNMEGYTAFTPDPTNVLTPSAPAGTLMPVGSGATISGFWNWGGYSDKFGVTKMYPDSGSTAIYQQEDGSYVVAMEAFLAPEPTYIGGVELNYPFAGVACSFDADESYYDLSDITTVHVVYKSQGVMRFALLDQETLLQDQEGGEPGYYLHPTEDWRAIDIDITANANDKFNALTYPSWVNFESYREDVVKAVRGIKFDVKMQKAGYASFALKEVSLLDATGNVVTNLKGINGIQTPKVTVQKSLLRREGNQIYYQQASNGAKLRVYDLNGTLLSSKSIQGSGQVAIDQLAPASGLYVLRLSDGANSQTLKIQK